MKGAIEGGNGDPELNLYGAPRTFSNKRGDSMVTDGVAMPNHAELSILRIITKPAQCYFRNLVKMIPTERALISLS